MPYTYTHVFAVPGATTVVDVIRPETGRLWHTGDTIEEASARRPDAQVMELGAFRKALHAAVCNTPVEISEAQWWDALECLPPVAWTNRSGAETFKLSERFTDDITSCYIKIGKRYFECLQPISTPHDTLAQMVLAKFPEARHG